jgi:hypothetical protein
MHQWCTIFGSDESDTWSEVMNPFTTHLVAQMRMEELLREAERYRSTKPDRSSLVTWFRQRAGRRLIEVGERLLPKPMIQPAGAKR